MKIKSIKLNNFRSYKEDFELEFNNITALTGQNDSGKSSILEALDIFFNEGKGVIKIDKQDKNVESQEDEILIGVIFNDLPNELIVDSTVATDLTSEYLLNQDGDLEIHKIFKNGKLQKTLIIAEQPDDLLIEGIHSLKIGELKVKANGEGIVVEDNRMASLFRKALLEAANKDNMVKVAVPIDKEGGKQIWGAIEKYLPIYSLFQSDRKNEDKDSEIQDPIKQIVKMVLERDDVKRKLEEVYNEIKRDSEDLAQRTLEKLAEMNSDIASQLTPSFQTPTWEKAFAFGLNSDNNIPLNKRGSGVRRLVLLNFFRAEAERRKESTKHDNIIYAFEEPESAQHPTHQKLLIEAFLELSQSEGTQVILTTHSPHIAKLLPLESLRLIDKTILNRVTFNSSEEILGKIIQTLGVLPDIEISEVSRVKVVVGVEGIHDVEFLTSINDSVEGLKDICDLHSKEVIILPMGGSSLQHWVNKQYLNRLKLAQVHIYDSDIGSNAAHKYSHYVEEINTQDNSRAFETKLRTMENYITPEVLREVHGEGVEEYIGGRNWNELDIIEIVARLLHKENSTSVRSWDELKKEKRVIKKANAKNKINTEYVRRLSKKHLVTFGLYEEVEEWFKSIAEYL